MNRSTFDLGGPPSVALAYMAGDRALPLSTIETPFFGLNYPGYVDPRGSYWHHNMHVNMDIATFLIEGRENRYLRHFFRDFAYNPNAIPEEEVERYVVQMRQPGNLRASLNYYGYIPADGGADGRADTGEAESPDACLEWSVFFRVALHRQCQGDLPQRSRWHDRRMRSLGL